MGSFGETTSKETCFSLYVEKGKLFLQLFWTLRFTMVAKKNILSEEFLLPWKKPGKMWCGKTRFTSYELRVDSFKAQVEIQKCDFKSTSLKFKSMSSNSRVTSSNPELKVQIHDFKNLLTSENSSEQP